MLHWNADERPRQTVHIAFDTVLTFKALTLVRGNLGDGASG